MEERNVVIKEGECIDDLQVSGYRIIQHEKRFKFGTDAVILQNFANLPKNARAADLGTGTGILPILICARMPGVTFEAVEIQEECAEMYGDIPFEKDIWQEMFLQAKKAEKKDGCSDLIPYWGLTEREDMVKIERIVPMYPFSRDEIAYERLIKILSLYRLTLGQARQEELLEYLFRECNNPAELKKLFINLSPFSKEKGE